MGHMKGFRAIYPPNSNEQQIKDWNIFYDEKEAALRKGITEFPYRQTSNMDTV